MSASLNIAKSLNATQLTCFASAVAITFALLTGCSRTATPASEADPHLAVLTKLYVDHLNAHQGLPPKDEAAFKSYVSQHGAHRLKDAATSDLNALFISTRDNQPLVFVYGASANPAKQTPLIGYERSAVDGKRTVGYRHGTAELVEESQFATLAPTAPTKF